MDSKETWSCTLYILGYCGSGTEIFQHLFGVQDKEALRHVTSANRYLMFGNEVPGFQTLHRNRPTVQTMSALVCVKKNRPLHILTFTRT